MFVNFNILNQLGSPAINSNTFANRPAAGQAGRLFVSTDTFEIYRDTGTTWDLIGGPGTSTITGTGTATQVAYFTSSQAIGSSANLFWDNTNTRLGIGTATPGYTIEANGAVKADRIYLTGATLASGVLYYNAIDDRVTVANYNTGGVVHIETNGGGPAAIFGSDYTGTFISGIGTRGYTASTSYAGLFNGSVGINTATPGAALDIHSTGIMVQLNSTSATANSLLAFQRSGNGVWRIGDAYNGGNNYFELHNTVLTNNAIQVLASSNEATFLSSKTYSTGNAIGVAVQHNLTIPNAVNVGLAAIGGVNSNLNLTLGGSTTVAATGRQGLEGSTSISFTGAGTLTMTQGSTVRAFSALGSVYAFNGSAVGTITHLAGLRICFPDNVGSAVNVTNNYALLINDQTTGTGTVTYTNRWGIYQEGASDLNYLAANLLIGSTTNSGEALQVTGTAKVTSTLTANSLVKSGGTASQILAADGSVITAGTNITIAAGTISASGGTISLSAIGSSPNANAATLTGTVLNLQPASSSFGGVVTTGTQTFAGAKTYNNPITLNGATGNEQLLFTNNGVNDWQIGTQTGDGTQNFSIYNYGTSARVLFFNKTTSFATFQTSVGINTSTIGSSLQINGNAAIGYSASTAAPTNGLAVAGASTYGNDMTLTKNGNAIAKFKIENTTAGTSSQSAIDLTSDSSSGSGNMGKYSSSSNSYKIITASNYYLYNTTAGDITLLNDVPSGTIKFAAGGSSSANLTITSAGDLSIADAKNIILSTTTGTKIGTATSQKLSFWNATPIVQPTTAVASAARVGGGGATVTDTDTFGGYTIAQVVQALRNTGILA